MATTVSWDGTYEVGHERIDSEHRVFLGLIRNLSIESNEKAGKARIERTLREIYKYADYHFTSEANIMADVNYPNVFEHKRAHQMLLAQLEGQLHDFRSGAQTPEEIVSLLVQWFALHTSREDTWFAQFLER